MAPGSLEPASKPRQARVLSPNSPTRCSPKSPCHGRGLRASRGAPFGATRRPLLLQPLFGVFVVATAVAIAAHTVPISYEDAKASLAAYPDQRPVVLRGKTDNAIAAAWPAWVATHNAEIRARLERGDEDSLVNFWLYGTTFTKAPRATQQDVARLGSRENVAELLQQRLADLVAGIESPGSNERLQFARRVVERHGIKPGTAPGRERTRAYLIGLRERMIAETERYRKTLESATLLTDERAKLNAYATA